MILAVAIATVPLIWAMHHEHRHGADESPRIDVADVVSATPTAALPGDWSVCPECSAVVFDQGLHEETFHAGVPAGAA
jgi:hypothetical protein